MLSVSVTGFEDLKRKIILLSDDKDKRSEVLLILKQVAKPTLAAAKAMAPVSRKAHNIRGKMIAPGNLKASIGFIVAKNINPTVIIGARTRGKNDGWYAHIVEGGHSVYKKGFKRKHIKTKGLGAITGSNVAPNRFLDRAVQSTKGVVNADAEKRLTAFIQRRINKLSS